MRYIALIALLLTFGCRRAEQDNATGSIELQYRADAALNVVSKAAVDYGIPTQVEDYGVQIASEVDGRVVYSAPSIEGLSQVPLVRGDYNITLSSTPAKDAQFDMPMYQGTAQFAVVTGQTTKVDVTCKLSCVVAQVSYSQNMKDKFASCRTTLWGKGKDKLVYEGVQADKLGYFAATAVLNYKIEVVTPQGFGYSKTGVVEGLAKGDLLKLNFDIGENQEQDSDPLVMDITLDRSINQVKQTFTLGMSFEGQGVPVITGRLVDLSVPVGVKYKEGSKISLDIGTAGGLKQVLFIFDGHHTQVAGATAPVMDVMEPLSRDALGITFDEGGTTGARQSLLNLSEFTKKLPGSENGTKPYTLTIGVSDNDGQYWARQIVFSVYGVTITTLGVSGNDVIDWFGTIGLGQRNMVNMVLHGQYNIDTEPQDMAFAYRQKGETAWRTAEVTVNQATKAVSADISIPAAINGQNTWQYRLTAGDENADTKEFTTLAYPVVGNMGLDTWSGGDYSNPTDGWSSPNANAVLDKVITTTEAPGWNGSGKSARISSVVVLGNFASGGLFSGGMVVVMPPNAYKSAQVGIPFSGRPKKLAGHYKYAGKKINNYGDGSEPGNGAVNGGDDMCEICVKLEKWDGGDYKIRWKDGLFGDVGDAYTYAPGTPNHPRFAKVASFDGNAGAFDADVRSRIAVGYGQLTSQGMEDWTRFEIDITYSQDVMPDHIIITAVSSAWGGYMTGAVGSTLYVDNFEFIY